MKNFSKVILFVMAISGSLHALPMLTDGEESIESKKQNSDKVTDVARLDEEGESDERRGTAILVQEKTQPSASLPVEEVVSPRPMGVDLSQLIMPRSFSSDERRQFQQDLQELKSSAHSARAPSSTKRARGLIQYWKAKGVEMDPEYVQNATACLKAAQGLTENTYRLKDQAEESFYESLEARENYYSAIHACEGFIETALQTAQAWKETATMYERMPGLHRSIETEERWVREAHQSKLKRREVLAALLSRAEGYSDHTRQMIDKMRGGYEILKSRENSDCAYALSNACEKVIAAQKAVMLAKENLKKIPADTNCPFDRNIILSLEMALKAAVSTICEADHVYGEVLPPERTENDLKAATEFCAAIEAWVEKHPPSSEKTETINGLFEQHAKALDDYAQKTLDAAHGAFSFLNDGTALGDETDFGDLSDARDAVNGMRSVLDNFQEIRTSADPWLQAKQELAISNLEQAVEQVHEIAQRLRNEDKYENNHNMNVILTHLQEIKEEYAVVVAAILKG